MVDSWIAFVIVDPATSAAIAWGHRVYQDLKAEDQQQEIQKLRDRLFAAEFALRSPSALNHMSATQLRGIRDRACDQLELKGFSRDVELARVGDRLSDLGLHKRRIKLAGEDHMIVRHRVRRPSAGIRGM